MAATTAFIGAHAEVAVEPGSGSIHQACCWPFFLFCAVLRCSVLCLIELRCGALFYLAFCNALLPRVSLLYAELCCAVVFCCVLHFTSLCCLLLFSFAALHCFARCYTCCCILHVSACCMLRACYGQAIAVSCWEVALGAAEHSVRGVTKAVVKPWGSY